MGSLRYRQRSPQFNYPSNPHRRGDSHRGCLIDILSRKVDVRTSMVISSIAFGIAHFDVANSIGTGLLGLVLAG